MQINQKDPQNLLAGTMFIFFTTLSTELGLPWWLGIKESACQCRKPEFDPWIRKIRCRRKWQPTLVFLPGKSHGQRSLGGYSPWDLKRVRHNLATKQQSTELSTRLAYSTHPMNNG